jgi:hypothetical protein
MSGAQSTKATNYTSEPAAHCTNAKAVDCKSEPGTDCMSAQAADCRSESAADCKSVAARNRDCPGTTAYCDSSATEARRNGRHSSSSDDYHCYSARSYAGWSCSDLNRDDQPIGDDHYPEACDRVAEADSRDDSIPRIQPARGHDRLHCPGPPMSASCSQVPAAEYYPSSNQACAASFPSRKAAGFARDHAAAESFRLHREKSPGARYFQIRCGPENQGRHGDRPSRRRFPDG